MTIEKKIEQFFASPAFGVVGASANRDKYGNKVLRCYQQNKLQAIPVHPIAEQIEGEICVNSVSLLPAKVQSLSIITPPQVTEKVVEQAAGHGIKNIWMQVGSESPAAIQYCEEQGINVIADGSCVLVVLGYHDH
ncbi:Predicted CoA-binding protein [Desulfuromusa kysingii]|uniref:Predicted CoA-binding protein n=1 Tax=Desulfuromusa kysingii TaxID=37625 RepID=A0A1H3XPL1_9BACT|nr:CoA-binding protein [Desulfuromusa kysingii]SEA00534.1 Predicted CoA-binding protein [Desulfuromusa kysingii]